MDVFINYGDSKRVIECGFWNGKNDVISCNKSGTYKCCHRLTKTNMLIIDEGFGALDELNIEACSIDF